MVASKKVAPKNDPVVKREEQAVHKISLKDKRDQVMKLREQVANARDKRLAAEVANQKKIEGVQLDSEIDRLKALLAQENSFLGDTTSDANDNKNKEV